MPPEGEAPVVGDGLGVYGSPIGNLKLPSVEGVLGFGKVAPQQGHTPAPVET